MATKFNEFAIALSGGGARGFMHAGFLKALEENDLKPVAISGASMGAIIGAMYASGVSPNDMLNAIIKPEILKLWKWLGLKGGLGSLDILRKQLQLFIHADRFEDLYIPLTVSVTNLNTGRNELINSGSLMEWVIASASIPIFFQPVLIGPHYYVDGGLSLNLPASCLQKKGRMVIALNSNHLDEVDDVFSTMKMVAERSLFIAVHNTMINEMAACDMFIDVEEVRRYGIFEFDQAEAIFKAGYEKGKANIPIIREKLNL